MTDTPGDDAVIALEETVSFTHVFMQSLGELGSNTWFFGYVEILRQLKILYLFI